MFVVDSSVWVSRFVSGDVHHSPSQTWLDTHIIDETPLFAPIILLPEVAGPIARRTGVVRAAQAGVGLIRELSSVTLVPVADELADQAAAVAADLKIRGADAIYVALAHRLGLALVTWDRQQLTRGRELVPTWRPSDLPQAT